MITSNKLTNLQQELLRLYALDINEKDLQNIKEILANYFLNKAETEIKSYWELNHLNENDMINWVSEHNRTTND